MVTGRAIVHFTYKERDKEYNSVILGLERTSSQYTLPGGDFNPKKDKDTLDTAIRELYEEFGLVATRSGAKKVYESVGRSGRKHHVYLVNATGRLKLQKSELKGVGFFNAGRHNQIPRSKLTTHVKDLIRKYFNTLNGNKNSSNVQIPGYYFINSIDSRIIDWHTQKKKF